MQIIRTVTWIAITAILVAFIAMNWTKVPVNFWPLDDGNYIHFEWPVGIVALVFFLLGMAPVWLYLRAMRWRMSRRIANLENSLRASSLPSINAHPAETVSTETAPEPTSSPTRTPEA
ncbi:LapA family protein [Novosphingobium mangrovi (ex Huang et al. 2023)]|uniref:LapA family protein n=1 Tax=Novosphingobium mangrovi (ex Huang et al. 2023) TaxID=2976432 RepID=A0ABT2I734_9SPHN|nr:LapA family protein [Novosphingobium mangrovi (ex Huang et al. 2023)]MCT2400634.1 LapA family protein [Novosphingobium mangrovi (ex Huang et al. 2023)]